MMNLFERFTRRLAYGLAIVGGVALFMMMVQTVADVVMSRVFNHPIEGNIEVISAYYMVLVVFLPLAMVELRHEHINADLFVRMLPKPMQRAVYIFGAVVSLLFFGFLTWQTWLDALKSLNIDEVLMGSIYVPVWPAKFSLPIGLLAIVLIIISHTINAVFSADFDPTPPDPASDASKLAI